ncbi:MaoC/PaaZ C-terminal domain-containing protein [Rhodococcus erythropolis]|uniref:MaoC/PaaZ C-terminal domain-containing protein n=1 Tax=Rhodococcus erythropolis TaxID=1833 RepID=UPI0022263E01|nr:MaoC/PaaZ C-terminal domain-containing protein [Rhodococcus erythropolis]MCW2295431.1 acyl dehydratase [Rhodococcus erythropolis]
MSIENDVDTPDLRQFGQWTDPDELTVTREGIREYALATNDSNERHLAGEIAGPVFAVIPAWRTGFPLLLSTLSPELQLRTLHGEQDITYHQPLVPGTTLHTRASLVGVRCSSSGTTITGRSVSRTPEGEPVLDQYTTLFVKGLQIPERGEIAPPRLSTDSLPAEGITSHRDGLDPDQTSRYSQASGDMEQIHLDPEVARAAGFPAVINHGNCTFAIAAHRVLNSACGGDVRRLRRLAVRFSRPVLLDDIIETHIGPISSNGTAAWESTLADGKPCLKNGYAEIIPSSV